MDASIIMRALVGEEVSGNRGGFMIFNEAEVISRFFCRKMLHSSSHGRHIVAFHKADMPFFPAQGSADGGEIKEIFI